MPSLNAIFDKEKVLYLLVGGWNTIFGFLVMIWLYAWLSEYLHVTLIAILANVLSISMSFLTYRYFVFKSQGSWFSEYLKCYLVYGGIALFGVILTWIFVDFFKLNIWISQSITVPVTVAVSYVGHKYFTFAKKYEEN